VYKYNPFCNSLHSPQNPEKSRLGGTIFLLVLVLSLVLVVLNGIETLSKAMEKGASVRTSVSGTDGLGGGGEEVLLGAINKNLWA